MASPETFPVKEDHAKTAITGQPHLLAQVLHRRRAFAEARQDADLDGHPPFPGLAQSRLIQIPLKSLHRIGIVLHHQLIDQLTECPELPVLQPEVVGLAEGAWRKADSSGETFLLQTQT